jgi:hypothetical protein
MITLEKRQAVLMALCKSENYPKYKMYSGFTAAFPDLLAAAGGNAIDLYNIMREFGEQGYVGKGGVNNNDVLYFTVTDMTHQVLRKSIDGDDD